jgi:hypothetical protein
LGYSVWRLAKLNVVAVRVLEEDLFRPVRTMFANVLDSTRIQPFGAWFDVGYPSCEMRAAMVGADILFPVPDEMKLMRPQGKPNSGEIKIGTRQFRKLHRLDVKVPAFFDVGDVKSNVIQSENIHPQFVVDRSASVNLFLLSVQTC